MPRPITQPSQIRLFLTVAPLIREQGRKRGRVKIGLLAEVKSNAGLVARQVDVGLVERPHGPDVLPVAVEQVGLDAMVGDRLGQELVAEVGGVARLEQVDQERAVEQVDAHAGQVGPAGAPCRPSFSSQFGSVRTRLSFSGVLGFSSKSMTRPSAWIRMMPHDRRLVLGHRQGAIVTAALFSRWVRIMSWKSIR